MHRHFRERPSLGGNVQTAGLTVVWAGDDVAMLGNLTVGKPYHFALAEPVLGTKWDEVVNVNLSEMIDGPVRCRAGIGHGVDIVLGLSGRFL